MLNYLKYRTQLNTFAGNVLNSHRVQCLENSYFLSAHADGKCSRDFEVIMKSEMMMNENKQCSVKYDANINRKGSFTDQQVRSKLYVRFP